MVMMLPFLLALIAILCMFARRRGMTIIAWVLMVAVLVAWLVYHSTSQLDLVF